MQVYTWISSPEMRVQKYILTFAVNRCSTIVPRQFNEEIIVFSTNGARTNGYSPAK